MRFFRSVLSAKPETIDPYITERLPQQPFAGFLGTEPTKKEVTTAIDEGHGKRESSAEPDGLPV